MFRRSTKHIVNHEHTQTNCYVYQDDREPRRLEHVTQIADVLAMPGAFVWLDLIAPHPDDFASIQKAFDLHPLAIEDAVHSHQRPKIESYGDSWFIIVQAASRSGAKLELHELAIFVGPRFVITVRALPPYPLNEVERRRHQLGNTMRHDSGSLLYTILDTIVDGYSPIAEAAEERIEALEASLLSAETRTNDVLLEIFEMRKSLGRFRSAVVPIHEILVPIMRGDLKFFIGDEVPYYRDVHDHVTRVIERLDRARELINNARDIHVTMATNRQAEVTKALTIVATIFLPLSFITGFYGQNFGFLVDHIADERSFWLLGIGTEFIAVASLLAFFRYKRWL